MQKASDLAPGLGAAGAELPALPRAHTTAAASGGRCPGGAAVKDEAFSVPGLTLPRPSSPAAPCRPEGLLQPSGGHPVTFYKSSF